MTALGLFVARWWPHILLCVISGAIAWLVTDAVWSARYAALQAEVAQKSAEYAKAEAEAVRQALVTERRQAQAIADISTQYEARISEIQSEADSRVGDLVNGNLRLRREIAAYATERLSAGAAAAVELGPEAQRGAELVSAAIGVGAACDAQVAGLQAAYEALRRPAP